MNEINQQQKRAVIYCRVSTKEQVEEGNSLVTQEKICRDYAFKNGYDIAEVFIEQGESAKSADRTELQRMMRYCANRRNKISAVIAYRVDRISRNTDDYSQIRILLKHNNVEIKSTSENFENTPVGRFLENTMANIAQFDNDIRSERSAGGMKEAMREGRYVWMASIGYKNVKIAGKATIAQDEKLGRLMHKTFTLVATNNYTIEEVRQTMAKEGLVNAKGKMLVKSYFYHMLTNPLYAGWIIKFGEKHRGTFEPIVSDDLFEQVQRVLKHTGTKHYQHITDHPDFPLRRFIFNDSGRKLTGSWSKGRRKKYAFYRFNDGANFSKDLLETSFMRYMDRFGLDKADFKDLLVYIRKHYAKHMESGQKEVIRLTKYLTELNEKQTALVKKNLDGILTDSVLANQLAIIEKELLNTNARLAEIEVAKDSNISLEDAIVYLQKYIETPSKIWFDAKIDRKIKLQRFQFPKGLVLSENLIGTTEICNLFKAKIAISEQNSTMVNFREQISNTLKAPNVVGDKLVHKNKGKKTTVFNHEFWKKFHEDAITAYNILKETENS